MRTDPDFLLVQAGMHFDPSRGGADRYFAELLRSLGDAGVSCHAAAFGTAPPGSPHHLTSLGPDDASLPARLMALQRYGGRFTGGRDPIVFAWHFALYGGAVLRHLPRCGTVAHFHGPWADESAAEGASWPVVMVKRWIERRVLRRAQKVIVLSSAFHKLVVERFGIPPARIATIPPAVDLQRFQPMDKEEARRAMGWPQHGPLVFCLRRMVRRMGIEELIASWEQVSNQYPDATLVLAGAGPLLPELESRAAALSSNDQSAPARRILFTGRLPDEMLPLAYSAATVSIVPSRSLEGFGLVALESLACGTPALVTPVGGLPEAVSGLDPALVLRSSEPDSLAAGLRQAFSRPGGLPDVSTCRRYAAENFSASLLASRVMATYQQSLKNMQSE